VYYFSIDLVEIMVRFIDLQLNNCISMLMLYCSGSETFCYCGSLYLHRKPLQPLGFVSFFWLDLVTS